MINTREEIERFVQIWDYLGLIEASGVLNEPESEIAQNAVLFIGQVRTMVENQRAMQQAAVATVRHLEEAGGNNQAGNAFSMANIKLCRTANSFSDTAKALTTIVEAEPFKRIVDFLGRHAHLLESPVASASVQKLDL